MESNFSFLTITAAFCLLFTACNQKQAKSEQESLPQKDTLVSEKTLTIVFLDVSGSFNKFQKQGGFKGKNYFDESCKELVKRIRTDMKIGQECLIVKSIRDKSFSDETLVCKIDLNDDKYIFQEPIPENDMKKNRWEMRRIEFEKNVKAKIYEDTEKAVLLINEFKDSYINKPANRTDIVNAFNGIKPVIESEKYSGFNKIFIVYSDFRENKQNLSKIKIDLQDVKIEGRFVSKNEFPTLEDFNKNQNEWRRILNCKNLIFKTPEECIK